MPTVIKLNKNNKKLVDVSISFYKIHMHSVMYTHSPILQCLCILFIHLIFIFADGQSFFILSLLFAIHFRPLHCIPFLQELLSYLLHLGVVSPCQQWKIRAPLDKRPEWKSSTVARIYSKNISRRPIFIYWHMYFLYIWIEMAYWKFTSCRKIVQP